MIVVQEEEVGIGSMVLGAPLGENMRVCVSVDCVSVCLSVHLSVCLSVHLSVCLSVYQYVYLSVF